MRCDNCGNEVADGNVYCQGCGKEVMVVPDYNVLEDDFLPSIIADEKQEEEDSTVPEKHKKRRRRRTTRNRHFRKMVFRVTFITIFVCVTGSLLFLNSYYYFYITAKTYDREKDWNNAVNSYTVALDKNRTPEAFMARGRDYYRMGSYDRAEEDFLSALLIKPNDSRSYNLLIKLYVKTEDYDGIEKLYNSTDNEEIREMFGENRIRPPEFSELEGSYEEPIILELFSEEDYDIYYTTDGSDPTDEDYGELYDPEEPIELENGSTVISAVCRDKDEWGRVVSQKYNIGDGIPEEPVVSPKEGTFHEETEIEISTESMDAEIYYSWSGEEPTEDSLYYSGPVNIPEGKNELTAIAISKSGVKSTVFRGEYNYEP